MGKLLRPDTSRVPLWRQRPKRSEAPIRAWRIWAAVHYPDLGWALSSVAADCVWEGPVIRAHKRPMDPALWDRDKDAMHEVFSIAGIHAVKTREQAQGLLRLYAANAYGEVALWGRVAQFELGYRAEVCMVKRVWLHNPFDLFDARNDERDVPYIRRRVNEMVDDLSRRYDCEVSVDG